jgi:DNA-binding NarL/FixJ family response regulator
VAAERAPAIRGTQKGRLMAQMAANDMSEEAHRGHVLVADDDPSVLRSTSKLLASAGFAVRCVGTRDSAMLAVAEHSYDLLVADINMPGNADLGLLEQLREEQLMIPVLLITGRPSIATALRALKLSVIDYLVKPVEPAELLRAVERGIEKGRALQFLREAERATETWSQWVDQLRAVLSIPGSQRLNELAGSSALPQTSSTAESSLRGEDVLQNLTATERDGLSRRERDVIKSFATTLSIPLVADELSISAHTVRSHLKSIFRKLDVDSQVVLLAKLHGRSSPK